jgi:hypothetical protein
VTFIPTQIAPCLPFPLRSPMTSAACLIVVSALLRELIKSADLTFVCFIERIARARVIDDERGGHILDVRFLMGCWIFACRTVGREQFLMDVYT